MAWAGLLEGAGCIEDKFRLRAGWTQGPETGEVEVWARGACGATRRGGMAGAGAICLDTDGAGLQARGSGP